jgi:hypothetical protein
VLGRLLPEADREAVIGDLVEECALRESRSALHESWWCLSQVSRSIAPLWWARARQEALLPLLGVAFAAFVAANIIEMVATMALVNLLVARPSVLWPVNFLVGLGAMAFGGGLAAWMRSGAAAAVALMIFVLVIVFMFTMTDGGGPLWYHIGFLFFGPLAALAGGAFLRRTRCKK